MIATFIAIGFACTTLYALRGWARAVSRGEAGDLALAYAKDLQHDVVELYQAAADMKRLSDEDADATQFARLATAAEEFRVTRDNRIKQILADFKAEAKTK